MTTQHISPDGLWHWDGTQWVANARPTAPAPKKRSSDRKVAAIVVGVGALCVALTAALGALGAIDGTPQPVKDKAEEISTYCFNQVPLANLPRISTVEEQLIRACAEGMLASGYVAAGMKSDVSEYLYAELLPDGA